MSKVIEIISLIGSIASCMGIYITYVQMRKVKTISEATHSATSAVVSLFRMVEVTKHCELIKSIQEALRSNHMRLALYQSQQLKSLLIDLLDSISYLETGIPLNFLQERRRILGIDVLNIHQSISENSQRLDRNRIIKNLELLSDDLQTLQAKLKNTLSNNHE